MTRRRDSGKLYEPLFSGDLVINDMTRSLWDADEPNANMIGLITSGEPMIVVITSLTTAVYVFTRYGTGWILRGRTGTLKAHT